MELNFDFKSAVERQGGSQYGQQWSAVVTHVMDVYVVEYTKEKNVGLLVWSGERNEGVPRSKIMLFDFVQDKEMCLGIQNYLILWSRSLFLPLDIWQYFQNILIG